MRKPPVSGPQGMRALQHQADIKNHSDYLENAAKFRCELALRIDDDLKAEVAAEMARARDEFEAAEAAHPFNQPYAMADFGYWAKHAYWTMEEGVALLLGRSPHAANTTQLKTVYGYSRFASEFNALLELAHRAVTTGELLGRTKPGAFLAWAKRYKLSVPATLEAAIVEYGHNVGDWKTAYDKATAVIKTQSEEVSLLNAAILSRDGTIAAQKAELTRLSELPKVAATPQDRASPEPPKPVGPRESDSMRKLIIGMAVEQYGYDPSMARSGAVENIATDLATTGVPLDSDTIRRHLQRASELLPPESAPERSASTRKNRPIAKRHRRP